jgi:hypothetical protein
MTDQNSSDDVIDVDDFLKRIRDENAEDLKRRILEKLTNNTKLRKKISEDPDFNIFWD